jgi:hypothetical protein
MLWNCMSRHSLSKHFRVHGAVLNTSSTNLRRSTCRPTVVVAARPSTAHFTIRAVGRFYGVGATYTF